MLYLSLTSGINLKNITNTNLYQMLYLSLTSGINLKNITNTNFFLDITKKEFFILCFTIFLNIFFGFIPNIFI